MAIKVGHASISEKGTIRGDAGEQNGKEVFTREWYKHSKGWVTLRAKDPAMREHIAVAMEKACANDDIGYDQIENQTLWENVKPFGFDPAKTTKKVETDCARLVRVCCQYACEQVGNGVQIPDFYTATLKSVLSKTGLFDILTDSKYNEQDSYLLRGDIQVTKTKGHTWIVLENGSKSGAENVPYVPEPVYKLGDRVLENGSIGEDVKELQEYLRLMNFDIGVWGADGEFGDATEAAVRAFQKAYNCVADGEVGAETLVALGEAMKAKEESDAENKRVRVTAIRSAYIRSGPGTDFPAVATVYRDAAYPLLAKAENGWRCICADGQMGWISPRMCEEI